MPVHVKYFDRAKALEAILFIAQNLNRASLHSVSKMFYVADKLHLQEYGRLICGDRYIAMEYGPVPSAIYNMMKVSADRSSIDVDWDEIIRDAFEIRQGRYVVPKREADRSLLSESEVECLTETIREHGSKSFGTLTDLTHDQAWHETGDDQTMSLESIARTLPNAQEITDYLLAR